MGGRDDDPQRQLPDVDGRAIPPRRLTASRKVRPDLAGANVKSLQRMLGHSSAEETLDTYADLFDDDLDSVAAALDRVVT